MGPQIIAHAPVELTKPPQGRIEVCSFRSRSLFWGFEWNERSNNSEENSNTRYKSEPQYILLVVLGALVSEKMSARRHKKYI